MQFRYSAHELLADIPTRIPTCSARGGCMAAMAPMGSIVRRALSKRWQATQVWRESFLKQGGE
jgi:hypothetical protein